jgi:hypothetical protein
MKRKLTIFILVGFFVASISPFFYNANTFAANPQIRITEIMYDPLGNGDKEFIEIYNGSDTTVNLSSWSFTNGVTFNFGGTTLASGSYGVIVRNSAAFRAAYPSARVFGQYVGKLLGSGELVRLVNSNGVEESRVDYRSSGGWPTGAKNGGPSLSLIRTTANENLAACWGTSNSTGGSPSSANSTSGGGAGCSNKSYLVSTPAPAPSTPAPSGGGSGSGGNSGSGGASNTQPNGQPGTPGQEVTDQTLINLTEEEKKKLEEDALSEEIEDAAGIQKDEAVAKDQPKAKMIAGIIIAAFIISAGAFVIIVEKMHLNLPKLRSNFIKFVSGKLKIFKK